MRKSDSKGGFSLTEVLLAVGTLAIGMLLVAGVFPVSIHFTTIATERTIAAIVADEAFAKIKLYAEGNPNDPNDNIDPTDPNNEPNVMASNELKPFNDVYADWWTIYTWRPDVLLLPASLPVQEFSYPSDGAVNIFGKQYFWSALCRQVARAGYLPVRGPSFSPLVNPPIPHPPRLPQPMGITWDPQSRLVQITVFVSRRISPNLRYPWFRDPTFPVLPQPGLPYVYPRPVWVPVRPFPPDRPSGQPTDQLEIIDVAPTDGFEQSLINDGSTIVDNRTGQIYRVLERHVDPRTQVYSIILLDRLWQGGEALQSVWVIPPALKAPANPTAGVAGRYPCIAVYQKIIRF